VDGERIFPVRAAVCPTGKTNRTSITIHHIAKSFKSFKKKHNSQTIFFSGKKRAAVPPAIRLPRGSHAGYRRETDLARAECPKEHFYLLF
jgi:hypothetical protein